MATSTKKWIQTIDALPRSRWPASTWPFVVDLGIGEGGRGATWNSENLWNFWSLKYRDGIGAGQVIAPDGYPTCAMRSADQALEVLWRFFHRPGKYPGFDDRLGDSRALLALVCPTFNAQGYWAPWKKLHFGLDYGQYIMQFYDEALEVLRERLAYAPEIPPAPAPGPVPEIPPAPAPIPNLPEPLRIERVAGIGDRMLGTTWRPVKNFDRIWIRPSRIFIHVPAALGLGVLDGWDNRLSGSSAHFYILRTGEIIQTVPLNYQAWGVRGWNGLSWHLELENFAWFYEGHRATRAWHDREARMFFRTFWPNVRQWVPQEEFVYLPDPLTGNFFWFHTFPEVQIAATARLLRALLPKCQAPARILGHGEVEPSRANDPGAAFPWPELRAAL